MQLCFKRQDTEGEVTDPHPAHCPRRRRPETAEAGPTLCDVAGGPSHLPQPRPSSVPDKSRALPTPCQLRAPGKPGERIPQQQPEGPGTPHSNSPPGHLVGSWDSFQPTSPRFWTPWYHSRPIESRFMPRDTDPSANGGKV